MSSTSGETTVTESTSTSSSTVTESTSTSSGTSASGISVFGTSSSGTSSSTTTSTSTSLSGLPSTQPSSSIPTSQPLVAAPTSTLNTSTSAVTGFSSQSNIATTLDIDPRNYKQLEEQLNRWINELNDHEQFFIQEAERISNWDRVLIKNADNIISLNEKVETCRFEHARLEQELAFIEGQQNELETFIQPLEHAFDDMKSGQIHSDYERESIFHLATQVDLELCQMITDLRQMADETNSAAYRVDNMMYTNVNDQEVIGNWQRHKDNQNALRQITRILDCHLHSLTGIDHKTDEIMERLESLDVN